MIERKHVIELGQLAPETITHLLDLADTFGGISRRQVKKVPTMRVGQSSISSWSPRRELASFELAAKRLSAHSNNRWLE